MNAPETFKERSNQKPTKETSNGYNGNTVSPRGSPEIMDSMFKGWTISKKDMVQYKDMQRRGLVFLFSAIRTAPNTVIYSPMNKFVSVYQKPDDTEENAGDFVLVSVSAGNPNDIRVMDITNEYYGDTELDPMYLIQKSIEMADDSGMLRLHEEFGDFGKVDMIETADSVLTEDFHEHTGAPQLETPTSSHITTAIAVEKKGNKLGKMLELARQWFTMKPGTSSSGPGALFRAGRTMLGKPGSKLSGKMAEEQYKFENKYKIEQLKSETALKTTMIKKDMYPDPHTAGIKTASSKLNTSLTEGKDTYAHGGDIHDLYKKSTDPNARKQSTSLPPIEPISGVAKPQSQKPVKPIQQQKPTSLAGAKVQAYIPPTSPMKQKSSKMKSQKSPKMSMNMGTFPSAPYK
jgi:hypothetical protein